VKALEIFGAMAGARTQPNGPVNGLTGTRVAQDTPVDVNQEVWQRSIFLSPVQRALHGRRESSRAPSSKYFHISGADLKSRT
jgi:hypothetical protein